MLASFHSFRVAILVLLVAIFCGLCLFASHRALVSQAQYLAPAAPLMNSGDLDTTFGTGGKVTTDFAGNYDEAFAVVLQPDGKILVAGYAQVGTNNTDFAVARYMPSGALDAAFGTGGKVTVGFSSFDRAKAIAVMPDGRIVVAGYAGTGSAITNDFALLRLTAEGALDPTFDGDGKLVINFLNGNDQANALVALADGRIVVAGTATISGRGANFALARLNLDGTSDTSFGSGGQVLLDFANRDDVINALLLQPDGKLLAAGYAMPVSSSTVLTDGALVRLNVNGSLDTTFDGDGRITFPFFGQSFAILGLVGLPDGKIVALGTAQGFGNTLLLRYQPDGTLDTTFGLNGKASVTTLLTNPTCLTLDGTGAIVVGGYADNFNDFGLVRYRLDGTLDNSFGVNGLARADFNGGRDQGQAVITQPDGKVLLVGASDLNSQPNFAVARFLAGPGCAYNVAPDAFGVPANGGSYTVPVAATAGCAWTTTNTNSFITLAGNGTGTGNGTVTFNVAANGDAARLATLTVAGHSIMFRQDAVNTNPLGVGHLDFGFDYDGAIITNLLASSSESASSVVLQPDGKFVLAGTVSEPYGEFLAVRYLPDGRIDPSFGMNGRTTTDFGGFSDSAADLVLQPDGKLVLAGTTTRDSSFNNADFALVRYQPNGALDTSFGVGGKVTLSLGGLSVITAVALQADGKIVAAGYSGTSNYKFALARFLSNGTPDNSFGVEGKVLLDFLGGGSARIYDMKLQPDGKVLAGGMAIGVNANGFALTRFLADGSLDTTFGTGGKILNRQFTAFNDCGLALQPDGKIIAGVETALLRYLPDGTPDASFGFNGQASASFSLDDINSVAVQTDGNILTTGSNPSSNFVVARNRGDGAQDLGFGTNGVTNIDLGGTDFPAQLLLQPDGNVIIAGRTFQTTQSDIVLARIINGPTCNYSVTPASRLVAANGGSATFAVATANGCAWTATRNSTFLTVTSGANSVGSGTVSVSIPANPSSLARTGTLTIAGNTAVVSQPGNFTAPPNAPGNFDTSFDDDGRVTTGFFSNSSDEGYAIATQYDDKIIVAGTASLGSSIDLALARYNPDGTLDQSFGAGGKVLTDFDSNWETAYAVAVQADGKIVAAGELRKIRQNNGTDFAAARYNPDGTLDPSFGTGGKASVDFGTDFIERLTAVVVQSDGKIVLAGYRFFGTNSDIALARLNADGTPDATFGDSGKLLTDFGSQYEVISTALLQSDGKIIVGGATSPNGNSTSLLLVRYLPDGTLDTTFGTGGRVVTTITGNNVVINALAWLENGKLLAAGRNTLTRYLADGTPDATFGANGTVSLDSAAGFLTGVAVQSSGKIVTGGNFNFDQGFRVARFNANGTPDTTFGNNGVTALTFYYDGTFSFNEKCRGVALLTNDDIIVTGAAGNTNSTGIDFALARLFGGAASGINLSGRLTDSNNRPLRGVPVTLSGAISRVITTDATGNYSFTDLKTGGDYTLKVNSSAYLTTPNRRDFVNLTASQTGLNFSADAALLPPLSVPLTDDFNGTRDNNKWNIGTLTRGLTSFDTAVAVMQANGQLAITPRANVPDAHFNGYVALNNFDFTNGAARVELVQAANGGGETAFALGAGPEFYARFAVLPVNANASQPDGSPNAPAAESPLLALQVRLGGQFRLLTVPYNPSAHRFLRLRHVPEAIPAPATNASPGGYLVFEASPANPINYTELFRVAVGPRSVAQMSIELSAGTSNPLNAPGTALFDNFAATSNSSAQFATASYSVNENVGQVTVTVTRTGDTTGAASVEYATAGGTAQAGARYLYTSGTLTFPANETSKTFTVPVLDNALADGTQTIEVVLSHGRGVAVQSPARTIITLLDNDMPAATNAIEDAQFFVTQQYYDFLNRAPDAEGLAYWTGQITTCGTDAACVRGRRIGVSAAFFVELEFQATGSVVYRLYRAAFGVQAAPNQTRAAIVYDEFSRDRAQLIGGPGLEQSTRELAERFVQREAFTAQYPVTQTNAQFVNKLFDTANLNPFTGERQAEIEAMNTQGRSRAQVLLNVINLGAFREREYNPSFVLMQYFGYLRRDPDQGGYDFWLNILNQQPANARGMVCAFLTSAEYQLRFGTQTPRSNAECGPGV